MLLTARPFQMKWADILVTCCCLKWTTLNRQALAPPPTPPTSSASSAPISVGTVLKLFSVGEPSSSNNSVNWRTKRIIEASRIRQEDEQHRNHGSVYRLESPTNLVSLSGKSRTPLLAQEPSRSPTTLFWLPILSIRLKWSATESRTGGCNTTLSRTTSDTTILAKIRHCLKQTAPIDISSCVEACYGNIPLCMRSGMFYQQRYKMREYVIYNVWLFFLQNNTVLTDTEAGE